MKKEVKPQKWREVRFRGRTMKREIIGSIATSLAKPFGMIFPMIKQ